MTPGDAKPPRHLGRITDPSVLEDGQNEPEVLEGAEPLAGPDPQAPVPAAELPEETKPANTPAPEFVRTGHPVRDRLLAKVAAAQAQNAAEAQKASESEYSRFASLDESSDELDEIAAPRSSRAPGPVRIAGTALSSTSWAVFGTLIGLSFIASLFTLLVQFSPKDGAPVSVVQSARRSPGAAATVAASATSPEVPPPAKRRLLKGPWRIGQAGSGQKLLTGTIGNSPFLKAIQERGIEKTQAYRIYTSLKDAKNLDRCRPKDSFKALIEVPSGVVKAFEYMENAENIYQARTSKDGLLVGRRLDLKVRKQRVQGALIMTSASFSEAAVRAHFDPGLGLIINKALEGHKSVEEFQKGDRLRVVAQEVTVLGEFSRYAGIEAMEYLPVSGKPTRVYYFGPKKDYYDSRGRAPGEGSWRRPVKGAPVTSKFNPNRMHPILKKRMPHTGTDFGAPTGTPVYAASSGKVVKLGSYGANGNFISIEHAGGYATGYSHLSRFEPGLKVGDKVKRLQPIGYVGSTGRSTGPHLHFSARKNGVYIDPESLNLDALARLPRDQRQALAKVRGKYDALLDAVALPAPLVVEPALDIAANAAVPSPPEVNAAPAMAPAPAQPPSPAGAGVTPAPQQTTQTTGLVGGGPAAPTPPAGKYNSLYLTDKELLETQASSASGEVDE